jgi:hypothetical protein
MIIFRFYTSLIIKIINDIKISILHVARMRSGGILLEFRENLVNHVQILENECEFVLWVKIALMYCKIVFVRCHLMNYISALGLIKRHNPNLRIDFGFE